MRCCSRSRAVRAARSAWPGPRLSNGEIGLSECGAASCRLARPARAGRGAGRPPTCPRAAVEPGATTITRRPDWQFDAALGIASSARNCASPRSPASPPRAGRAHAAAAALLSYAEHTQGRALAHVQRLTVQRASELIDLPPTTHRNLELTQTLRGQDAPTLLSTARRLRHRHGQPGAAPLADPAAARARRSRAAPRRHRRAARRGPRARCAARCATSPTSSGSAPGSPCARCGRASSPACARRCRRCRRCAPPCPRRRAPALDVRAGAVAARLDPRACCRRRWPTSRRRCVRDGGVIAAGHDAELDELRAIGRGSDAFLLELEARERAAQRHRRTCASSSTGCTASSSRSRRARRQGAGRLPAPADDEERRALHHARAEGVRGQGALGRRARAGAREVLYDALLDALAAAARAALGGGARAGDARRAGRAGRVRASARAGAGRSSCASRASRSSAAAIRWSRRGCRSAASRSCQRLPARRASAGCSSSPAPTWAARAPSCARWR